MKTKHGLSQYRLNSAKSYAQNFLEAVGKIEMMFQLSVEGCIDEKLAENYIKSNIEEIEEDWEYFQSYIKQRDDMK